MRIKIIGPFLVIYLFCVIGFAQERDGTKQEAFKAKNQSHNMASGLAQTQARSFRGDNPPQQDVAKTESHPDRLTDIPDDVGPIMTVATIQFKAEAEPNGASGLSKEFGEMLEAMKRAKGFMGLRLLQSGDKPPMLVAISWWKNRKSLVDWYYNPAHQKMVKSFHSGNGSASRPVKDMISHIGIEFYAPLRGGISIGEKFGPTQKPVE